MKEIITANGIVYECQNVTTGVDNITFTVSGQSVTDMESAFRDVSELSVSGEGGEVYGRYDHLAFESASVLADGTVSVTMHIKDKIERRLDALEEGQELQDGAIQELAGIVGGE